VASAHGLDNAGTNQAVFFAAVLFTPARFAAFFVVLFAAVFFADDFFIVLFAADFFADDFFAADFFAAFFAVFLVAMYSPMSVALRHSSFCPNRIAGICFSGEKYFTTAHSAARVRRRPGKFFRIVYRFFS
jgi:hypothetical protein